MTHSPSVFIVVLSNNRLDDTLACLASISQNNYKNCRVISLVNDPRAGFAETIQQKYPEVQIISLFENLGYAGNNNIGIKASMKQGADWIFILNDDTVLHPSCISSLVEVGESDPAIGIVGPMVYHFDEPDIIQSAGGRLGWNWQSMHLDMNQPDTGQYLSARQVDWISGCAILVRRGLVEQVGALDPDYYLYWEEMEWSIRATRAGWKVFHVPGAKLWHRGVKRDYEPRPYVTYYMTRNYLHTLVKHRAPFLVRVSALTYVLRTLLSWSVKPQWRYKRDHRNAMWKGLLDFINNRMGPMHF